ncbi:uncharacterized protein LOC135399921 [Ornithodoros turicata]|uniref:uncharacterized protein LOC135399921 n=1 Tax=Ornithodoros turicata TaxID=34597 RepID=UPI00313A2D07
MTTTTHYAPYRRADASQDIYIVVSFCMLMFLSAMVVALMLIAEYRQYTNRKTSEEPSSTSEDVIVPYKTSRGSSARALQEQTTQATRPATASVGVTTVNSTSSYATIKG